MKKPNERNRHSSGRSQGKLLPAIVAVGGACGIAAAPASALELGELQIDSTLGQPLRASIAFALNPNEQLFDFCVSLRPGVPGALVPTVSRAQVAVRGNRIFLSGNTPVMDPLLNVRVAVDCPYSPRLERSYTLIVDPVLPVRNDVLFAEQTAPSTTASLSLSTPAASPATVASNSASRNTSAIEMFSDYRVQNGDSLSAIAARVTGRTSSMRSAIDLLVAANPGAFIDNDANRIMAGSLLSIPDLTEGASPAEATPASAPVPVSEPVVADVPEAGEPAVPQSVALTPESPEVSDDIAANLPAPPAVTNDVVVDTPATEPVAQLQEPLIVMEAVEAAPAASAPVAVVDESPVNEEPVIESPVNENSADELVRGDVVMIPAVESNTPVVTAPTVSTSTADASATGSAWSWIVWAAGGTAALIFGLLFFGGRIRERFGSVAINAPRPDDSPQSEEVEKPEPIIDDVDFEFNDTISAEAISLDADLDAGTGLQDSGEMDVAQDFGFSTVAPAESAVDHELPEEAAREPVQHDTDMIPPSHKLEEASILEAEVAPETDADDYDMSMIVDATKQSIDDYDATAKDLHAVAVDQDDDYSISDDTMTSEADLAVLEQDYQEEFTQTQALNKEIEQAAMELAKRMDDDQVVATTDFDPGLEPTAEMPARSLDLEITAEMPEATSNEEVTAELTANLPTDVDAENDDLVDDDEITSKFAAAGGDVTVEMQVESGRVDTKKGES